MSVFYCDSLVREVTTSSPSGCHITPCSPDDKPYSPPGAPELVPLPLDSLSAQRRGDDCSPPSPPAALERGVLLWMTPDGLYACRLCPEQVFWEGGPSPYGDKPNKLEREHTCKLLNTQDYLTGGLGALTGRFVLRQLGSLPEMENRILFFSGRFQSSPHGLAVTHMSCDFFYSSHLAHRCGVRFASKISRTFQSHCLRSHNISEESPKTLTIEHPRSVPLIPLLC